MILLVLLAALTLPPQQSNTIPQTKGPVPPEQVLAWQLEGLTPEELREEMASRGLTECAEQPLLNALAAARTDVETVQAVRHAKAPCTVWKLGLQSPRPTDYLYEITGAMMWNDWGYALQTIRAETMKQPGNADVHLIYAHLLEMSEDWIAAYGEATTAVRLAPESPYAHAQRSTICFHSRLSECALAEAMTVVRMRPRDAVAYIVLGHARELQGYDDEALLAYAEAKRLNAGYAEMFAGFGRVYGRQGAFEQALKAFDEAIRLDGGEAEYFCDMAQLYQTEGYTDKAIEKWKKAKELAPNRAEILLALGNTYLMAQRYPEAVREYRELLELRPEMEAQLVNALRAEGHETEAAAVGTEGVMK